MFYYRMLLHLILKGRRILIQVWLYRAKENWRNLQDRMEALEIRSTPKLIQLSRIQILNQYYLIYNLRSNIYAIPIELQPYGTEILGPSGWQPNDEFHTTCGKVGKIQLSILILKDLKTIQQIVKKEMLNLFVVVVKIDRRDS